ncbi:helix-turn-helix domain-containing protein [Hwangdonia sp.]|uniref:helix-turn-helix domain-containing protein n=1 Tax=Hwangdonia sp. TaxID=1883432 RepID=UPI003AB697E1
MCTDLGKDDFKLLFGNNLNRIRVSKNLSFRKLAQRCDIDYSNLNKIEKGKINISLSTILELAKGLDIHPKELFDFEIDEDN